MSALKPEPKGTPEEKARKILPDIMLAYEYTLCNGTSDTARVMAAKSIIRIADLDDPVKLRKSRKFSAKFEARKQMATVHRELTKLLDSPHEMPRIQAADLLTKLAKTDEVAEVIPPLVFGDALAKHEAEQALANGLKELPA